MKKNKHKVGQLVIVKKYMPNLYDDYKCRIGQIWEITALANGDKEYPISLIHSKTKTGYWGANERFLDSYFSPLKGLAKILYV